MDCICGQQNQNASDTNIENLRDVQCLNFDDMESVMEWDCDHVDQNEVVKYNGWSELVLVQIRCLFADGVRQLRLMVLCWRQQKQQQGVQE